MTRAWRDVAIGGIVVAAIAVLGAAMALQGWRSRVPNPDSIPSINGAFALLETGGLPDRGVLNSFLSYVPPGATWLFVPGARYSSDPRLTEYPGAAMLSVGTLLGVFLLARKYFGLRSAVLAVALYGLSEAGVKYFGTVGPRGHPFFYVWMVYCTCEWVTRKSAWFLAGALSAWVAGMYVFLELAPAIFMLPAVWLFFRPPIRIRPLAFVAVLTLLMWWPYLRFESGRGFADLQSQLLLRTMPVEDETALLCNPTLRFRETSSAPGGQPVSARTAFAADGTPAGGGVALRVGRRILALGTGSLATFGTVIPGVDIALLALTVCGILVLSVSGREGRLSALGQAWFTAAAVLLLGAALCLSPPITRALIGTDRVVTAFTASSIRTVQMLLVLAAVTVFAWRFFTRGMRGLRSAMELAGADPRPVIVSLVVTWAVCLLVVEYGRGERMSFLWPVQAVVLAAMTMAMSKVATRSAAIGAALVLTVVMAGPAITVTTAMQQSGWSGVDAEEIGIAADIAGDLRSVRRSEAAIGYEIVVAHTWGARFVQADPRYKIGADFDLLLMHPHRIVNTSRCVEGVSRDDEFRLVSTAPPPNEALEYVAVPRDASFVPVRTYPSYELRQRPLRSRPRAYR